MSSTVTSTPCCILAQCMGLRTYAWSLFVLAQICMHLVTYRKHQHSVHGTSVSAIARQKNSIVITWPIG
jgi:hypothetical protein